MDFCKKKLGTILISFRYEVFCHQMTSQKPITNIRTGNKIMYYKYIWQILPCLEDCTINSDKDKFNYVTRRTLGKITISGFYFKQFWILRFMTTNTSLLSLKICFHNNVFAKYNSWLSMQTYFMNFNIMQMHKEEFCI